MVSYSIQIPFVNSLSNSNLIFLYKLWLLIAILSQVSWSMDKILAISTEYGLFFTGEKILLSSIEEISLALQSFSYDFLS